MWPLRWTPNSQTPNTLQLKYSEGHYVCMQILYIKIMYVSIKAKTASAFARDHQKLQVVDYLLAWGLSSSSGDPLSYCSTSARTHTLFSTSNPQPLRDDKQNIWYLFRNNNWHAVFIKKYTVAVMRTLTWVICVCPQEGSKDYMSLTNDYCGRQHLDMKETYWHGFLSMFTVAIIPVDTCGTCRLRGINSCWCECGSSALCQCNRGERVVAGRASRQTPPTSRGSPLTGWGFEVGCQGQNYPHYRFQITIDNVCRQKGSTCPSIMNKCTAVLATHCWKSYNRVSVSVMTWGLWM